MSKELITMDDAEAIDHQRKQLAKWLSIVHEEPKRILKNKFANNSNYIPISDIEMKLDELFLDGWNLEIKSFNQTLNAVVVCVRISGLNPATGREFFRDGIGSKALQLKSGSKAMDITSIQSNACELAFPAAKAQAFKNAAQSIGKVFGRDVAREIQDEYNPIIKPGDEVDLKEFKTKIEKCKNQTEITSVMAKAKKLLQAEHYNDLRQYGIEVFKAKGSK